MGSLVGRDYLATLTYSALGQLAAGLSMLTLAQRLSSQVFGAFAALYFSSLMLSALFDFGSSSSFSRAVAKETLALNSFLSWSLRRIMVLIPLSVCFLGTAISLFGDVLGSGVAAILGIQFITFAVSWPVFALTPVVFSAVLQAKSLLIGNLLVLLAVTLSSSANLLLFAALSASSSWLVSAWISVRRWPFTKSLPKKSGNPWSGSLWFATQSISSFASFLLAPIVAWRLTYLESAQLAAVLRWVGPLLLPGQVLATLLFPRLVRVGSMKQGLLILRGLWYVLPLQLGLISCGYFAADFLIVQLLPEDYVASGLILRTLILGTLPLSLLHVGVVFLQAQGLERVAALIRAAALVSSIGLGTLLLPRIGVAGLVALEGMGSVVACMAVALVVRMKLQPS